MNSKIWGISRTKIVWSILATIACIVMGLITGRGIGFIVMISTVLKMGSILIFSDYAIISIALAVVYDLILGGLDMGRGWRLNIGVEGIILLVGLLVEIFLLIRNKRDGNGDKVSRKNRLIYRLKGEVRVLSTIKRALIYNFYLICVLTCMNIFKITLVGSMWTVTPIAYSMALVFRIYDVYVFGFINSFVLLYINYMGVIVGMTDYMSIVLNASIVITLGISVMDYNKNKTYAIG